MSVAGVLVRQGKTAGENEPGGLVRPQTLAERLEYLGQIFPPKVTANTCIDPLPEKGGSSPTSGAYFFFDRREEKLALHHLRTAVLSEAAAYALRESLAPGQLIIGVPRYYAGLDKPAQSTVANIRRITGAVWMITSSRVVRIRGAHQREQPCCYGQRPNPLFVEYRVRDTEMCFPFVEPEDLREEMALDIDTWKEMLTGDDGE